MRCLHELNDNQNKLYSAALDWVDARVEYEKFTVKAHKVVGKHPSNHCHEQDLGYNVSYLVTKLNNGNQDFAGRMHVRSSTSLFLQTQEKIQGLVQPLVLGQLFGLRDLLFDDFGTVDVHLDDLADILEDVVDLALGVVAFLL